MRIRKEIEEWWMRKRLKWAISLLKNINISMKRLGWARQRHRVFWREFSKSQRFQDDIYNELLNAKH